MPSSQYYVRILQKLASLLKSQCTLQLPLYLLNMVIFRTLKLHHLAIDLQNCDAEVTYEFENLIPNHVVVTFSFDEDMQPGLTIKTRSRQQWTPIAP